MAHVEIEGRRESRELDPVSRERTALNLHEIARRVGLATSALCLYFPSKAALYEVLYRLGVQLVRDGDDRAFAEHPPNWERVQAWFENRPAIAERHPDLYYLAQDMPVPGFVPYWSSTSVRSPRC